VLTYTLKAMCEISSGRCLSQWPCWPRRDAQSASKVQPFMGWDNVVFPLGKRLGKARKIIMATYHFSAKMMSRSAGRSSVAAAAYRSAELITDQRQGLEHDYSRRSGVLHTEIMAPPEAPEVLRSRVTLWNVVEVAEKRKDAQLAREVVVALPHEVSDGQRLELVRGFAKTAFVDRGMIADIAIHAPGKEGDQRNHHAHIMLTTRSVGAEGFGGKDRSWNDKALLKEWREDWAEHVNIYLREYEDVPKVDHRSLADQRDEKLALKDQALAEGDTKAAQALEIEAVALNRDPLPDIGWKAWGMERRGIQTTAGDLWRAAYERFKDVQEVVAGLKARFSETYAQVKDVAGRSFSGLAEALRGADLSRVDAANKRFEAREKAETQVERQAELDKSAEDVKEIYKGFERQRQKGFER